MDAQARPLRLAAHRPAGTTGTTDSEAAPPRPPAHLSAPSKRWWRQVVTTFVLESHHLRILQAACEAWDRMVQARQAIDEHGMLVRDRFGQLQTNPAVQIERDCRTAVYRGIRELDLDVEPPKELPRVAGRK